MNILLIDIGNTRVKWAVLRAGKLGAGKAAAHEGSADVLSKVLQGVRVDRVVAVSVAGRRLNEALSRAVRQRFGIRVEFVKSERSAGGVTNGYREVWRLGADRWVAAHGAHALARGKPVLYAMAGTALTVDLVTATGRHRGGAIIPGPGAMVAGLLSGTNGIRRRARGGKASASSLFASDTASALAAGSEFAAAAFIDRAVEQATQLLKARPVLLLSGGGADGLRRKLHTPVRVVPDLVLRGLAELSRLTRA
jgi:type III pantothenate kinase